MPPRMHILLIRHNLMEAPLIRDVITVYLRAFGNDIVILGLTLILSKLNVKLHNLQKEFPENSAVENITFLNMLIFGLNFVNV